MVTAQFHLAMIYKRGKILSFGTNRLGGRQNGCGWNDLSLHAEIMAIKNAGDTSKLRGANLIVVRISPAGEIVYSKPCERCQLVLEKCIKMYGLRYVYYS